MTTKIPLKKQSISTITPGLYKIGDRVRPVHAGEYHLYGHGKIVSIKTTGNPYTIKFSSARLNMSYREDEICR